MCGALSDERTGLSFTNAAGSRQRSHSQVRVPWDSQPNFTLSDSRLPFRRLLRLSGLRWRYSKTPPHRIEATVHRNPFYKRELWWQRLHKRVTSAAKHRHRGDERQGLSQLNLAEYWAKFYTHLGFEVLREPNLRILFSVMWRHTFCRRWQAFQSNAQRLSTGSKRKARKLSMSSWRGLSPSLRNVGKLAIIDDTAWW
jgi:hypothetical protein